MVSMKQYFFLNLLTRQAPSLQVCCEVKLLGCADTTIQCHPAHDLTMCLIPMKSGYKSLGINR